MMGKLLDCSYAIRQSFCSMAKSRPSSTPAPDEIADLRDEIASLKDHIRLLVDAIDEVREELSWLTRNGLPSSEPLPPVPVLKRMAVDPCAEDWRERLVIDRGDSDRSSSDGTSELVQPTAAATPPPSPVRPGLLF